MKSKIDFLEPWKSFNGALPRVVTRTVMLYALVLTILTISLIIIVDGQLTHGILSDSVPVILMQVTVSLGRQLDLPIAWP